VVKLALLTIRPQGVQRASKQTTSLGELWRVAVGVSFSFCHVAKVVVTEDQQVWQWYGLWRLYLHLVVISGHGGGNKFWWLRTFVGLDLCSSLHLDVNNVCFVKDGGRCISAAPWHSSTERACGATFSFSAMLGIKTWDTTVLAKIVSAGKTTLAGGTRNWCRSALTSSTIDTNKLYSRVGLFWYLHRLTLVY
jgi:hypothetical protein